MVHAKMVAFVESLLPLIVNLILIVILVGFCGWRVLYSEPPIKDPPR